MHRLVVAAGEVTRAGPLDLDDPGAQVGELPGGEWGRDGLLQRDDQQPLERQPLAGEAGRAGGVFPPSR
jgi:hypothetical protein